MAIRRIIGLPSFDYYHGVTIDEFFYSIGVEEGLDGKVELFDNNQMNDPPQVVLKDALETTTLWDMKYIVKL
jgi:hypothetical protein